MKLTKVPRLPRCSKFNVSTKVSINVRTAGGMQHRVSACFGQGRCDVVDALLFDKDQRQIGAAHRPSNGYGGGIRGQMERIRDLHSEPRSRRYAFVDPAAEGTGVLVNVTSRELIGATVMSVAGELDVASSPQLAAAVAGVTNGARRLVVDLSATEFLDSCATRTIVAAAREASTRQVTTALVCPVNNRNVRRVLDFMGVDTVIPLFDDVQSAAGATS